jgi:hypothetical protein
MFHINEKKLIKEEKEKGVAKVSYYEGVCLTCQHSMNREARAACPKADFFPVMVYVSRLDGTKSKKHICKNWELCSEITSCFKKNQGTETTTFSKPKEIIKENSYKRYHK